MDKARHVPIRLSVIRPAWQKLREIMMLQQRVLVQSKDRIKALQECVNLKDPVGGPLKMEAHSRVGVPHLVEHAREDRQQQVILRLVSNERSNCIFVIAACTSISPKLGPYFRAHLRIGQ